MVELSIGVLGGCLFALRPRSRSVTPAPSAAMNSRLYLGHSIQSNSSTVAYGASLFDGKLVRILIEKLSDVIDLAEKFFPFGLVQFYREPSEPVHTLRRSFR